jgi:precorrin-6Y C5,15-methyltransferase (decarboxylating)
MPDTISVIGIEGNGTIGMTDDAFIELAQSSSVLLGSTRQIQLLSELLSKTGIPVQTWEATDRAMLAEIESHQGNVLVLASGDPGYFGIVRSIAQAWPDIPLAVHPSSSSISLAFARIGLNWEDAVVISAHGRRYGDFLMKLLDAVDSSDPYLKLAVLCSPDNPPDFIAQILLDARATFEHCFVLQRIGYQDELIEELSLQSICQKTFDSLSILIVLRERRPEATVGNHVLAHRSGQPYHRRGMITKEEVREVIVSKLQPHLDTGKKCLWDIGAGSGSIALSVRNRLPETQLVLIDKDPISLRLLQLNCGNLENATILNSDAAKQLPSLPDPDAIFIGGGGIAVVRRLRETLTRPTFVLASYASINRAVESADILGNLMQVILPTGKKLPDGSWRLSGENPVFLTWGFLP